MGTIPGHFLQHFVGLNLVVLHKPLAGQRGEKPGSWLQGMEDNMTAARSWSPLFTPHSRALPGEGKRSHIWSTRGGSAKGAGSTGAFPEGSQHPLMPSAGNAKFTSYRKHFHCLSRQGALDTGGLLAWLTPRPESAQVPSWAAPTIFCAPPTPTVQHQPNTSSPSCSGRSSQTSHLGHPAPGPATGPSLLPAAPPTFVRPSGNRLPLSSWG